MSGSIFSCSRTTGGLAALLACSQVQQHDRTMSFEPPCQATASSCKGCCCPRTTPELCTPRRLAKVSFSYCSRGDYIDWLLKLHGLSLTSFCIARQRQPACGARCCQRAAVCVWHRPRAAQLVPCGAAGVARRASAGRARQRHARKRSCCASAAPYDASEPRTPWRSASVPSLCGPRCVAVSR